VVGSGQLQGSSTAVSLRSSRHERPVVTGGPFLQSKEVIGGYYVIDATDRDEVVDCARLLPELSGDHVGVEIWPLVERR
jgi:hypothetical protein